MNINKFFYKKSKETQKAYIQRLRMVQNKASEIIKAQEQLQAFIPENLQNFCKIANINEDSIVVFVYPAMYLRLLNSQQTKILSNIRANFPDEYGHIKKIESKVRPLTNFSPDKAKSLPNSQTNEQNNSQTYAQTDAQKQEELQALNKAQAFVGEVNSKSRLHNSQDFLQQKQPKSAAVKQKFLTLAQETQDPDLKKQLELMAKD